MHRIFAACKWDILSNHVQPSKKQNLKPSCNLQRGKLACNLHTMHFVPWVCAALSFQSGVGRWLWASKQTVLAITPSPALCVRCQHRDVQCTTTGLFRPINKKARICRGKTKTATCVNCKEVREFPPSARVNLRFLSSPPWWSVVQQCHLEKVNLRSRSIGASIFFLKKSDFWFSFCPT